MGPSLKPNKFPRKLQDTYPNGQLKMIIKIRGRSRPSEICLKAEVTSGMFILLGIANSRQDLKDFLRKYFTVQVNYAP